MRPTAIIAAVASLALLPACTEETEPSPMPTSEDALTTATQEPEDDAATSEPEETTEEPTTEEPDAEGPPKMPAEAEEQTEEGAEAFVAHYLDTYNSSFATGDATPLVDLGTENCASCTELIDSIPTTGQPGDDYLDYSPPSGLLQDEGARIDVDIEQRALDGGESTEGRILFTLDWSDDGWEIAEIQVQQP